MKKRLILKKAAIIFLAIFITGFSATAQNEFITVWNTGASSSIQFPLQATGYTLSVINMNTNSTEQTLALSSTIAAPVIVSGLSLNTNYRFEVSVPAASSANRFLATISSDRTKLLQISQWGDVVWGDMNFAFDGCTNMDVTATDNPTLTSWCGRMFADCVSLIGNASFNNWNTSQVIGMQEMFHGATSFNQNISNWNTSSVIGMRGMFLRAQSFNNGGQPLNTNGSSWNTQNVTDMAFMFNGATSFNQDISLWNTGSVTDMANMFNGATSFNQNIGAWNTEKVVDMSNMFHGATSFNQDISLWNTGSVSFMNGMFQAAVFNQPIGRWNTANVTDMTGMFAYNSAFNQDIGSWNTANVNSMYGMFGLASSFNQNLGAWDLSSISTVGEYSNLTLMFTQSGMDCINYSHTLLGWANNTNTPDNLSLGADMLTYASDAQASKDYLINTKGWSITDAGVGNCNIVTSVQFHGFSAFLQNNELLLNWNTLSEINNDKFIVEISKNGIDGWKQIGEIKSKAENGNSTAGIDYSFKIGLGSALGMMSMTLLFGLFMPGVSRRKRVILSILALAMTVGYFSCQKSDLIAESKTGEKIFVRLSQIDKDGTTKVLKIQEAVRK